MKTSAKKYAVIIIAAALALALSLTAIAYAVGLFGFHPLLVEEKTDEGWSEDCNYQISLTQPQAAPEGADPEIADMLDKNRRALEEWKASNPGYSAVTDPSYDSGYYEGTRSAEEKTRLEEIAEKYGLTLRGDITLLWSSETTGLTGEQFFTNAELVDILSGAACAGALFYETPADFDKVHFYDEGTFGVAWYVDLPSCGERYGCYGYNSMYGTLTDTNEVLDFQEDIESFTQRSHTAPDGTQLTILSNGNEAYIYVYLENSFFTEHVSPCIYSSQPRDSIVLTDEDIDYIADCIDYSVIGKTE